jgi:hypothetical protein
MSFAQEAGKWRGGIEGGYVPYWGYLGAVEVKYNLKDNKNIGVRAESMNYYLETYRNGKINSCFITYDYYSNPYNSKHFLPFVGAGLGYYSYTARYYLDSLSSSLTEKKISNPTIFIRTGFEMWKIKVALTYNVVKKPSEKIQKFKNNDYISLSIGFYLGGGKWKKTLLSE